MYSSKPKTELKIMADFEPGLQDLDAWIERLYSCKPLTENELKQLTEKVKEIFVLYL